jgi:hypothetical protein
MSKIYLVVGSGYRNDLSGMKVDRLLHGRISGNMVNMAVNNPGSESVGYDLKVAIIP